MAYCCNKFCLFSCFCLLFLYIPSTLNAFYFHLAHQNHVHPSKFGLNGFLSGSDGKESACNARDRGSIPESGRCPRKGNGNPLQYSCLENSMDRGTWQASVHGVAKSRRQQQQTLPYFQLFYIASFAHLPAGGNLALLFVSYCVLSLVTQHD